MQKLFAPIVPVVETAMFEQLNLILFSNLPAQDVNDSVADMTVFTPDEAPKFTGGEQAMMKYIATNVKYPAVAKENENPENGAATSLFSISDMEIL